MLIVLLILIMVTAVIVSIVAAKKHPMGWLKSRWMDCVLFISTSLSFIFSIGFSARIAIYVSDTNVPIDAVIGGTVMNLALFFVPGLLFISSLILGVRLVRGGSK